MSAVLALVAAVVFGPHIANGGFYSDDWGKAAAYRFAEPPRLLSVAGDLQQDVGTRFLLTLLLPVPHALFGRDMAAHLALATGLGVLSVSSFYVLLRVLGLERRHALPVALLALVFPWDDAVRLWSTAGVHTVAITFYFLGTIVALRGLQATGRKSIAIHGAAQLLYILAILTYEAPLPLLLLSVLLYVHRAPTLRIAISRWRADVILVALLLVALSLSSDRSLPPLHALAAAPLRFLAGAVALFGHSLFPFGFSDLVAVLAAFGIVLIVRQAWRSAPPGRTAEPEVRRWAVVACTAVPFAAAGHLMLFGTGLLPVAAGIDNRGNIVSAFAYVTFAYSLVMLIACLTVAGGRSERRRRTQAIGIAAAGVLLVAYGIQVRHDARLWDRASDEQQHVLARVREAIPSPARGSTLYVVGAPSRLLLGYPIFMERWDLDGAAKLMYEDPSVSAYPIYEGARFVCGPRSMYPSRGVKPDGPDGGFGPAQGARYGKSFVVDASRGRATAIGSRSECVVAAKRFRPGPILATS